MPEALDVAIRSGRRGILGVPICSQRIARTDVWCLVDNGMQSRPACPTTRPAFLRFRFGEEHAGAPASLVRWAMPVEGLAGCEQAWPQSCSHPEREDIDRGWPPSATARWMLVVVPSDSRVRPAKDQSLTGRQARRLRCFHRSTGSVSGCRLDARGVVRRQAVALFLRHNWRSWGRRRRRGAWKQDITLETGLSGNIPRHSS